MRLVNLVIQGVSFVPTLLISVLCVLIMRLEYLIGNVFMSVHMGTLLTLTIDFVNLIFRFRKVLFMSMDANSTNSIAKSTKNAKTVTKTVKLAGTMNHLIVIPAKEANTFTISQNSHGTAMIVIRLQ